MKVIVAGAGPGSADFYTAAMTDAVRNADRVFTSDRLTGSMKKINGKAEAASVTDTVKFINENAAEDMTLCVVASGDTGFYSIASTIAKGVQDDIKTEFIPAVGSLQYFASKCRMGYEHMKLVSLHGNSASVVPHVCYNEKVFALTGGTVKAHHIIGQLAEAGFDDVEIFVGEKLSLPDERIVSGTVSSLASEEFDDLSVMIIVNGEYADRYRTLKDSDFIRGERPMTKEAVRTLSAAALEIEPGDVVYDIGAGTGSVTCAMALKAFESIVYAVEKEDEGCRLIGENMDKLSIRNIEIIRNTAPKGMEELPAADKVFVGGSTGNLAEITDAVLAKNGEAVFVVTAVTLETLAEAVSVFDSRGFDKEISCVNVANSHKLGSYNLMKAENPVYIIKGAKKFEE